MNLCYHKNKEFLDDLSSYLLAREHSVICSSLIVIINNEKPALTKTIS
jgi:hypothetical protein